MFRRDNQIRTSIEVDSGKIAHFFIVGAACCLKRSAPTVTISVAWMVISQFLRLARVPEAVHALRQGLRITDQVWQLLRPNCCRVVPNAEYLENAPWCRVIEVLEQHSPACGLVQ